MTTNKTNPGSQRRPVRTAAVLVLSLLMLAACADIKMRAGRKVDVEQVQQFTLGRSTAGEVRNKLGEPYGKGRAYLPYQQKHVDTWTYYYELGTLSDVRRTFAALCRGLVRRRAGRLTARQRRELLDR